MGSKVEARRLMSALESNTPLDDVPGIGPAIATELAELVTV